MRETTNFIWWMCHIIFQCSKGYRWNNFKHYFKMAFGYNRRHLLEDNFKIENYRGWNFRSFKQLCCNCKESYVAGMGDFGSEDKVCTQHYECRIKKEAVDPCGSCKDFKQKDR